MMKNEPAAYKSIILLVSIHQRFFNTSAAVFLDQLASRCGIADMSKIKKEESDQMVPSWH